MASTQRRLKWPYVLGILAGVLAGLILFVLLKMRKMDDQTRSWVVSELQRRFNSEVKLENLHVSLFPDMSVTGGKHASVLHA